MDAPTPPQPAFDAIVALKALWGVVVTFVLFWFTKYVGKVDTLEKHAVTREELEKHLREMRDERRVMHEENKALMDRGSSKMDRISRDLQRLAVEVAARVGKGNRADDEEQ